jgi:hypothetical protein
LAFAHCNFIGMEQETIYVDNGVPGDGDGTGVTAIEIDKKTPKISCTRMLL